MSAKLIETKNKVEDGLVFKISHFKRKIKKTKPHKHDDYHELIFLQEGEGFHQIEEKQFLIKVQKPDRETTRNRSKLTRATDFD